MASGCCTASQTVTAVATITATGPSMMNHGQRCLYQGFAGGFLKLLCMIDSFSAAR